MITGFNTNVRHRGRVFHVQTEDSGRNHPHVISHLYFGGTILASEKRDYSALLEGDGNLSTAVRILMEEQHRAMLECLNRGEFDGLIAERLDGASRGAEAAPPPAAGTDDHRAFGEGVVSDKPLDEVILEYLVEKARTRSADGRTGRGNRSRE